MKQVKLFEEFINEAYSDADIDKIDTAYWAEYNDELPEDKSFADHSTNFEETFKTAIDAFKARSGEPNATEQVWIKKLAYRYFKVEKWISVSIVLAMLDQVKISEGIDSPAQSKKTIKELVSLYRSKYGTTNTVDKIANFAFNNWSNITGLPLNTRHDHAEWPVELLALAKAITNNPKFWNIATSQEFHINFN